MKKLVPWILLAAMLAGFWAAGRMNASLLDLRREQGLDQGEPLSNSPPLVVFTTVALGGFRGVLVDVLWLRASTLQEQGRYFELVQLADWITKLEPRFSQVWAFHAWNLAYNISVLFSDPADRWRWVRHGISLLRDEGLFYNAGDAQLYRELGWLFQHKIGGRYDTAYLYYQQAWAREMTDLIGGASPDYDALLAARPGTPAFETARRLRDIYKLDPARMRQLDGEYGPFDWRLPQAHAVYWAAQGRRYARGFEASAADRMIYQSMNDAVGEGSLFLDEENHVFLPSPRLDLVPRARAAYERAIAAHPEVVNMQVAYEVFLRSAVLLLYIDARADEAADLLDELRRRYDPEDARAGLEAFAVSQFLLEHGGEDAVDPKTVLDDAAYQHGFWKALGQSARAAGYEKLLELCWKQFRSDRRAPVPSLREIREDARRHVAERFKGLPAGRIK